MDLHVCETVDEYRDYVISRSYNERGKWPLLAPMEDDRLLRWKAVLAKLKDIRDFNDYSDKGVIVSTDSAFRYVAILLGAVAGAKVAEIEEPELEHFVTSADHQAYTFVGARQTLSGKRLRDIAKKISVPWSVITGYDVAAAAFCALKIIGRSDQNKPRWLALDVIHDNFEHIDAGGTVSVSSTYEELSHLLEVSVEGISLSVHGEGAHADLGRAVLCGICGPTELDQLGREVHGGCRANPTDIYCKRRHERHSMLMPFYALKTRQMLFLTCNGYSPAAEMYPSDVSAVLSALDGEICEVVTTLHPISIDTGVLRKLTCQAADLGLGAALDSLTIVGNQQGMPSTAVHIGAISRARSSARPVYSNSFHRNRVGRGLKFRRTTDRLIERADFITTYSTIRAGNDSENVRQLARELSDRLNLLKQLSLSIELSAEFENLTALLEPAIGHWDNSFGEFLNHSSYFDPFSIFQLGQLCASIETDLGCERCGCRVLSTTRKGTRTFSKFTEMTMCPTCGQRDAYWTDSFTTDVIAPSLTQRDSTIAVQIAQISKPPDSTPAGRANVYIEARDKANGAVFFKELCRPAHSNVSISLQVPETIKPDLHTLKVVWAQGLTFSVARRRFATV